MMICSRELQAFSVPGACSNTGFTIQGPSQGRDLNRGTFLTHSGHLQIRTGRFLLNLLGGLVGWSTETLRSARLLNLAACLRWLAANGLLFSRVLLAASLWTAGCCGRPLPGAAHPPACRPECPQPSCPHGVLLPLPR